MLRYRNTTTSLAMVCAAGLLATTLRAQADLADVDCDTGPNAPCIVTTTKLPLRLLAKPQSNVYAQMDTQSGQLTPNVPAFSAYYAYEAVDVSYDENFKATGWFRVGANETGPEGYMLADDVVPWKQALALAFTNPGPSERKPVLMFGTADDLDATLSEIEDGTTTAEDLYDKAMAAPPAPDGVISREGNSWVDIEKSFYLMPILAYSDLSYFSPNNDLKGVQLAALTAAARSQQASACDLQQQDAGKCIQQQSGSFSSQLGMDAVFVIDMTVSMQPYIDAVRGAVRDAARALSANFSSTSEKLRIGLVGYRDSPEHSPGIEFAAKNFTPDLLSAEEFIELMDTGVVKAATVGSGDFTEDVFAGLKAAVDSNWSNEAARIVFLIGDASGHPVGSPKNSTGLDEKSIRELAKQNNIYIASIYVGSNESDFALARPQYEGVASGDGESAIAFARVQDQGQEASLEVSLRDAIDKFIAFLGTGDFGKLMSSSTSADDTVGQAMLAAARAAFVDYIGTEAQPPSNIVAWALDRDPTAFEKKAFDIKLLVKRKDMEELMLLLNSLLEQLRGGQKTGTAFFGNIQQGSTAASYDLGISNTDKIATSDRVPTFIRNLPYKSEVLSLSLEEFQNASPDDRAIFEQRIESLISLYNNILNNSDVWVLLNDEAFAEEKVYLLDLANLP